MSQRTVFSFNGVEVEIEETLEERVVTVTIHDTLNGFTNTDQLYLLLGEIERRISTAFLKSEGTA